MNLKKVCVYCASSNSCDPDYLEAAEHIGRILANNGITIVYGGGSNGLMGKLADSALLEGGKVIGILPRFMQNLEWGHKGLTELYLVETLHERKELMIKDTDAVIALPGGCGTFEELLEAITLKRLALYFNPILIVNIKGFYDSLFSLLDHSIHENFMRPKHREMWTVINNPEEVIEGIKNSTVWDTKSRDFAAL